MLNPLAKILIKAQRRDRGAEEKVVWIEAETGVTQPQAKECLHLPEDARGRK